MYVCIANYKFNEKYNFCCKYCIALGGKEFPYLTHSLKYLSYG